MIERQSSEIELPQKHAIVAATVCCGLYQLSYWLSASTQ